MARMNLSPEQRQNMDMENGLWWPGVGGRGGSGMDCKFGVGRCHLLHSEWMDNEVLLRSKGTMWNMMGENVRKRMCTHGHFPYRSRAKPNIHSQGGPESRLPKRRATFSERTMVLRSPRPRPLCWNPGVPLGRVTCERGRAASRTSPPRCCPRSGWCL